MKTLPSKYVPAQRVRQRYYNNDRKRYSRVIIVDFEEVILYYTW